MSEILALFAAVGWAIALIQSLRHEAATIEPGAQVVEIPEEDPRSGTNE